MATPTKAQTQKKAAPAKQRPSSGAANSKFAPKHGDETLLFDRKNYTLMIIGVALILLSFALMVGGKSHDPHKFLYNEIYSFRRITLAPIVALIGFGLEVYAIMRKPKEENPA